MAWELRNGYGRDVDWWAPGIITFQLMCGASGELTAIARVEDSLKGTREDGVLQRSVRRFVALRFQRLFMFPRGSTYTTIRGLGPIIPPVEWYFGA